MRFRLSLLSICVSAVSALALEPAQVVVVYNSSVPASREVAEHYRAKRNIPAANLIGIPLPDRESIERLDYERRIAAPLREQLQSRKNQVKALLLIYGMPLRIGDVIPNAEEKAKLKQLQPEWEAARKTVAELEKATPRDPAKITAAQAAVERLTRMRRLYSHAESRASVDSELMLLWWPEYPLTRWVLNPLYFQVAESVRAGKEPVLMTARLDGPSAAIAKRLVDDAVAVEAQGLKGKAYFDARDIRYDSKSNRDYTGYGGYDESFREAAQLLKAGGMDVTLDNKSALFAPGTCPDAAIYAGWYSHGKYIDSCRFVKGAVAWHLASSEATTLRNGESRVWCPNLLKAGVAATLGPVAEPYTVGFPKPAEFFGFLGTGKYTLVECYTKSLLFASWMGVLVGDPLYNPFQKHPIVPERDVVPSPKRR
ncbi:MAG: TIGR03790 family protein [Bacteroidales bacterium]|nr:TIGR03790 family protein [Bacteroidales bacterium]